MDNTMEKKKDIARKISQGLFIDEFGALKYTVDKTDEGQPHYLLSYESVNPLMNEDSIKYSKEDKERLLRIAIQNQEHLIKSFIEQYGKHRMTITNIPFDSSIADYLEKSEFTPVDGKPAYLAEQVNYVNF